MKNFILLPKTSQRIQFNKTEIIKNRSEWQKILKLQYRFIIHNTQLNRGLFTRNCFGVKLQFLYQNLQNIEICKKSFTEIFQVKIGLSPELMNYVLNFETILPAKKFAIQARGSKRQNMA